MIPASPQTIKQSLNKAYRLIKPKRAAIEAFKGKLTYLLDQIDEKESEENVKIHLMDFLKNTFYHPDHLVATKGKTDFVIHTGKEAKTPAGILFEVKRPSNKADMVTRHNLNAKALHELMLYYLRERLDHNNTDVRHLVITNLYEWFVFDAHDFERLFGKNTELRKDYDAWKAGQKISGNTDHFYKEIAKPHLDKLTEELPFTYFNLRDFEKALRNDAKQDDNQLIGLYKILSPVHLLKLPFTNDSNSLDKGFYAELLHLIGLEEIKVGNKKLIQRKAPARRQTGSLLENAILTIETEDRLRKLNPPSAYGSTEEERLFNVALELCITWVNRILFLKLLEAQLIKYHRGDATYKFLNHATIPQYDELNKLFFQVLAKKPESRTAAIQQKYGHVPYLNSSLFEPTDLEDDMIRVNSLDDMVNLDLYPGTVLRDAKNKPVAQSLNALEYLLRFLDAYDFASEGREEIQEESKTLINAAVLGLIFEKINGYKDGSIYTPGFITMYMCRQAIRLAVVQKFNETYHWQAETFDDLKNHLADHKGTAKILEFNHLLNNLHICDPAVGSGHFLVSALNELIALKAELKLLADSKGVRLTDHEVTIENDELIITDHRTQDIFEYTVSPAASGKGNYVAPETQRVQQTLFHEKQTIIENCLFGVDINPNSVKICRLRLWIELLKNAYYTENSGFAELETLPNIDINIKQGNSLISRFGLDTDLKEALRGTKYSVAQYRSFVQEYKTSHNKDRKRELERIINSIKADFRTEIYRNDPKVKRLQKLTGELQVLTTQTTVFEPSAKEQKARQQQQQKLQADIVTLSAGIDEIKSNAIYRNAFEWRFEFPEVLDNDGNFAGFDVVIGNPPYIRQEEVKEMSSYFENNYESFSGKSDIYVFFYEKGIDILRKDGVINLITSGKFFEASYGKTLIEFLINESAINSIINFNDLPVFDGVTAYPLIFFAKKSKKEEFTFPYYNLKSLPDSSLQAKLETVQPLLTAKSIFIENGYKFVDNIIASIISKSKKDSITLKEFCGLPIVGVKTGYNEGFITELDLGKYIKKYIFGRDIKKYQPVLSNNRIVFPYELDFSIANLDKEHEIISSLIKNKEKLSARAIIKDGLSTGSKYWYEYQQINKTLNYATEYIVYPNVSFGNNFTLSKGAVIDMTVFLIKSNSRYLLAILNSKLVAFLMNIWSISRRGGYLEYKVQYVEKIPIKNITEYNQKPFIQLVEQILLAKQHNIKADTSALEKQIDELVYQLYELTPEEIAIVEGS